MANETVKQEDSSEITTSVAPQSAFCSSLRSKKFFMIDALPTEGVAVSGCQQSLLVPGDSTSDWPRRRLGSS